MAPNLYSSLCLGEIQQEDVYLTLMTTIGIMEPVKGNSYGGTSQIREALCQSSQRNMPKNENMDQQISKNNSKFESGQSVMVKRQAHHTFEPKYLLYYKVLKILTDRTLLVVTLDGKERETNWN